MNQIIIINKQTLDIINEVFIVAEKWLEKDAPYSHSKSRVRAMYETLLMAKKNLHLDLNEFNQNKQILQEIVEKLNAEKSETQTGN